MHLCIVCSDTCKPVWPTSHDEALIAYVYKYRYDQK
jgi:hypothetical protein